MATKVPPALRHGSEVERKQKAVLADLQIGVAREVSEKSTAQLQGPLPALLPPPTLLPVGPQQPNIAGEADPEKGVAKGKGKRSDRGGPKRGRETKDAPVPPSLSEDISEQALEEEPAPLKRLRRGKGKESTSAPPPSMIEELEDEPSVPMPGLAYEVTPEGAEELKHIKTSILPRDVTFNPSLFDSPSSPPARAALITEQFWTEGWAAFSSSATPSRKLLAAKAMNARTLALIDEVESSVEVAQRDKRDAETALRHADNMLKEINDLKAQLSIARKSSSEERANAKRLQEDNDKLKHDLHASESDVAALCKKLDDSNRAQSIASEALAAANAAKLKLEAEAAAVNEKLGRELEARAKAEEDLASLEKHMQTRITEVLEQTVATRVENALKTRVSEAVQDFKDTFEETPEYEAMQRVFGNLGARMALGDVKEAFPTLDLSSIEAFYPEPQDAPADPLDASSKGSPEGVPPQ